MVIELSQKTCIKFLLVFNHKKKYKQINHSCTPNAEITFKDNNYMLTLVATSDILPGEEILISYLDECHLGKLI